LLEARQIDASNGRLTADVTGGVETDEGVLMIHRIHAAMHLKAPERVKETLERTQQLCDALPPVEWFQSPVC